MSKEYDIREMESFPAGTIFTAHSKAAEEDFLKIAPIFAYGEDAKSTDFPVKVGKELAEKVQHSRDILRQHGLVRRLRFLDIRLSPQKNGSSYRKWNNTDKEWAACELYGAMLETYVDAAGTVVASNYFSNVTINYSMSRRLRDEEKSQLKVKDKWGQRITKDQDFYEGQRLTNCPSCGAPLDKDFKDIACPYCGSTIFADYYDWQIESIEIEPESFLQGFIAIFKGREPGQRVINKHKGRRNKIVRFSENDFRQDVLDSCRAEQGEDNLVDLYLGELIITSVRNTETDTVLGVKVPVYKVTADERGNIAFTQEKLRAKFIRTRYPHKFNKKTAVISAEKECPTCGGPFSPDDKGNCTYCGAFLFKDNLIWKKA